MDNTGSPETQTPTPTPVKKEGGFGSVSAIVIILVLLVLGGVYYFMASVDGLEGESGTTTEEEMQNDVAALEAQGSSDELSAIEADVNATDLSGLDEASAGFESELETQ